MEKVVQKISVHLTERDFEILGDLYRFGFLTFRQLKEKYFPNHSKSTLSNRLSRLRFSGFVDSYPVGDLPDGIGNRHTKTSDRKIGTIIRLTRKGLGALREHSPDRYTAELLATPMTALHHDSIVHSLLLWCERDHADIRVVPGEALKRRSGGERSQIPDALLVDEKTGRRIALEVELTQKSESRYREIVLQYQLSRAYDEFLYVTGSTAIEMKLKKIILGGRNGDGLSASSFFPFSFIPISKILREKAFDPFSSPESAPGECHCFTLRHFNRQ